MATPQVVEAQEEKPPNTNHANALSDYNDKCSDDTHVCCNSEVSLTTPKTDMVDESRN